jgi:hypothetical protein
MSDGGKGSKQRPTDKEKFDQNWDNIFGKKKKTEAEKFDEQVIMQHEYYDIDDQTIEAFKRA